MRQEDHEFKVSLVYKRIHSFYRNKLSRERKGCLLCIVTLTAFSVLLVEFYWRPGTSICQLSHYFMIYFIMINLYLKNHVLQLYCNLNLYFGMQIYLTLRLLRIFNHLMKKRKTKPDIQSSDTPSQWAHMPCCPHTYLTLMKPWGLFLHIAWCRSGGNPDALHTHFLLPPRTR